MNILKYLPVAVSLIVVSGSVQATVVDFKSLADASLGESAWNPLMFKADGTHTTTASEAFLTITAKRGTADAYAYMDSNSAGLGACFVLNSGAVANQANPGSGANLCNPSSDDNITYYIPATGGVGIAESVHFAFSTGVTLDNIWLNNNHDGDKSLLNDKVLVGIDGGMPATTVIANGGASVDSSLGSLGTLTSLSIGFDPSQSFCGPGDTNNNCELYISKIEFSEPDFGQGVPEPATLALMGLGLAGIGYRCRRSKKA